MSETIPSMATDPRQVTDLAARMRAEQRRATRSALLSSLGTFVGAIVAILVIWQGAIIVFGLSPFVAKGPVDVWRYFVSEPDADAKRTEVWDNLVVKICDAVIGFVAGLVLATVIAVAFQLSKGLEAALKLVPMRRYGKPEEIAAAMAFLASDDAAYITGQIIRVNGGMSMGG